MNRLRQAFNNAVETLASTSKPRRHALLWLIGALSALALPPLYLFPVLLIALGLYYALLARVPTIGQACFAAFFFHLGYYMAGLYWIGSALLVDSDKFAWLLPLSAAGLPAILSLYGVLHAAISHWIAKRFSYFTLAHAFLFALAYVLFEWVRGHALTGFPWNLLGYSFGVSDYLLQTASIAGVYGLSFLAVLFGMAIAFWQHGKNRLPQISLALFGAMFLFGVARLTGADNSVADGVYLRIVQGNIAQSMKWDRERVFANFYTYINLSRGPAAQPVTHIVWPETAIPFPVEQYRAPRMEMAGIIPKRGLLLTGAPRVDVAPDGTIRNLYNSLIAVDRDGDIAAHYNKAHLVPFGEYVPLAQYLKIEKIANGLTDYSPGPGLQTLSLPGLPPFSPLICYEAIFPNAAEKPDLSAQWLLNVTNDAWYGETAGPYQHLAHARMRAVEQGLPMIRAANTGISAVIDPYGRILSFLPLGTAGVLDAELPRPIPQRTLYARANKVLYSLFGL